MFRSILAFSLLATTLVHAQGKGPNPYLSQAKVYYQDLEFERCLQRLGQALKWENTPREDAEVSLYNGLCNLGLGKDKVARKDFEMAIKLDSTIALPVQQSPKVQGVFAAAKQAVVPETAVTTVPNTTAAPLVVIEPNKETPKDAPTKTVLTPETTQTPAIVVANEPPSRVVPITLAVATGVALAAGLVLGVLAQGRATTANTSKFESDAIKYGDEAKGLATGANVSYVTGGVLGIGALIAFFATNPTEETEKLPE
jgi:hypothetical protein